MKVQKLAAGEARSNLSVHGQTVYWVHVDLSRLSSVHYRQVSLSTGYSQTDWRCLCHAFYEQSLATDQVSIAEETALIPDLHIIIHFAVRFGSMDALVGRFTEACALPHVHASV